MAAKDEVGRSIWSTPDVLPYNAKVKTMDMMISIPDQVADKLRQRASASGQPVGDYTARIVQQAVQGPTLEELLAPVQADFARSGMTETQLLDLGRDLLDKVRSKK
jgi:hypothetical protein